MLVLTVGLSAAADCQRKEEPGVVCETDRQYFVRIALTVTAG